jgi:hypothetical protein
MGHMRDQWVAAKKTLDGVKVDTKKLFKEDLGPALDAFETADQHYDNISGKAKQDAIDAARKARKAAAEKAYKIAASYVAAVKLFESGMKDPNTKKLLDKALSVLAFQIAGQLEKVTKGKTG